MKPTYRLQEKERGPDLLRYARHAGTAVSRTRAVALRLPPNSIFRTLEGYVAKYHHQPVLEYNRN